MWKKTYPRNLSYLRTSVLWHVLFNVLTVVKLLLERLYPNKRKKLTRKWPTAVVQRASSPSKKASHVIQHKHQHRNATHGKHKDT